MTKKILLTIFTILLLSVPAFGQDYIVGEDDVLKVMVYDHDDMTTTVRVSGDGTIILPLLNRVNVAGMTITAISEKVSKLLADGYIVNPQVNMFIEEFRSKKVVILGQVIKPGLYELSGVTSLLELISKAGGLTKDAGGTTIIKRKTGSGDADRNDVMTIDMTRLIEKGDTSQNVMMMSGDNVYIEKAGVYYVTGEVKKPDAYKFEEDMTVIKAITKAGGFSDKASKGTVNIIRRIHDREEVMEKAKMDEPILPEDVIVVPESFF